MNTNKILEAAVTAASHSVLAYSLSPYDDFMKGERFGAMRVLTAVLEAIGYSVDDAHVAAGKMVDQKLFGVPGRTKNEH